MDECLILPPEGARFIIARLNALGFRAYVVGGCVRDALLGRAPSDWDVCTSARPDETRRAFADCRVAETGLKHGTLTIVLADGVYETTTFRDDGEYSDFRHPDRVRYVDELWRDLARRDLTINAMAYAPGEGLTDRFGGRGDLRDKLVRCVGDPRERFREDALRVLRALRFASTLGFGIEACTGEAMRELAPLIAHVSAERVAAEIKRFLAGADAGALIADYAAVLAAALPELACADGESWRRAARAVAACRPDADARLALLLGALGDETRAEAALRRLKLDNRAIRTVSALTRRLDGDIPPDEAGARRLLCELGERDARLLAEARRALGAADGSAGREERALALARALERVVEQKQCYRLADLRVNGDDLLALGLPPGRRVGEALRELFALALDGRLPNERAALLEKAAELAARERASKAPLPPLPPPTCR